jgi:hypothetical protein
MIKNEDGTESTEINIFLFEILKMCIDRILNEFDESDNDIGVFGQKDTTPSFKIAFNTPVFEMPFSFNCSTNRFLFH